MPDLASSPSGRLAPLQRVLQTLGDPASLSVLVTLVYLPVGLIGPVLIDPPRIGGPPLQWLVVALAGQVVLTCVVLGSARVVRMAGPVTAPWLTILSLMVAALARAITIAMVAAGMELAGLQEVGYRLATALGAQVVILLLIAYAVSARAVHSAIADRLESQLEQLALLNATASTRLDEVRQEIAARVHETVDPLVADLDRLLAGLSSERGVPDVRASIRRAIAADLRPLSHGLERGQEQGSQPEPTGPSRTSARLPLPDQMPIRSLILPGLGGLIAASLGWTQAIRDLDPQEWVTFSCLSGVGVFALLSLLRLAIGSWTPVLWLGVTVGALASGGAQFAAVLIQTALGLPVPAPILVPAAVFGVLVGAITAFGMAVGARRSATEQSLREAVTALQLAGSRVRQETLVAQRQLGYVIHGSVQSALQSAALRLTESAAADPVMMESIRRDILTALSRLDSMASSPEVLRDTLTDITDLWAGICDITWSVEDDEWQVLDRSPMTAASVAEVARELISNAVNHGGATQVRVVVSHHGDRVVVTVCDDGRNSAEGAPPGLGSRLLDEMCLFWTRHSDATGTTVVAELAT